MTTPLFCVKVEGMIDYTLFQLGLKDDEVKAFLYLLENGAQTAGNLAKRTGISRPSLYVFLKNLENLGLVVESQKNGVKVFGTATREKINSIFERRIDELQKGKGDVEKAFLELQAGKISTSPKLQFFEGKDGLQHILTDMLLYKNIETKAYWPIKSMLDILSENFFESLNKERIQRKIYTKAIWPDNQTVDIKKHPYLGSGIGFLREIRIAPKDINFSMGYWVYGRKTAFISSKKEAFGFIIESRELAETLSSQFDVIWKFSKPLLLSKSSEREVEEWLREI